MSYRWNHKGKKKSPTKQNRKQPTKTIWSWACWCDSDQDHMSNPGLTKLRKYARLTWEPGLWETGLAGEVDRGIGPGGGASAWIKHPSLPDTVPDTWDTQTQTTSTTHAGDKKHQLFLCENRAAGREGWLPCVTDPPHDTARVPAQSRADLSPALSAGPLQHLSASLWFPGGSRKIFPGNQGMAMQRGTANSRSLWLT